MKEIKVMYNNEVFKVMMNRYKVVLGESTENKMNFFKTLSNFLNQTIESEFGNENRKTTVLIDEISIDFKRAIVSEITPFVDLTLFFKATAKSITTKYIESKLRDIELDDLYQTFMYVYDQLSREVIQTKTSIKFDDIKMKFSLEPISIKLLTKMMRFSLSKDNYLANQYDLEVIEKVKLCVLLIKEVAQLNMDYNFYILLSCIDLDDEIIRFIESLPQNVFTLIHPIKVNTKIKKENIIYMGNQFIDFASEEDIYEKLLLNTSDTNDIDEFKSKIDQIFDTTNMNNLSEVPLFKNI